MNPADIAQARHRAGHTQTQAGELVGGTLRTWQDWEAGRRAMPGAAWELYQLKTGQHPEFELVKKSA